jgi:hypothetical protein
MVGLEASYSPEPLYKLALKSLAAFWHSQGRHHEVDRMPHHAGAPSTSHARPEQPKGDTPRKRANKLEDEFRCVERCSIAGFERWCTNQRCTNTQAEALDDDDDLQACRASLGEWRPC